MNSDYNMKSNNLQFSAFIFQFIIVFCSMIMTSCVNDIPYDEEIGAPKVVLNALLFPDSALTATVSRTAHFLDTEGPQRLADAKVTATVNGTAMSLSYDAIAQNYRSDYILRTGDEVTLTATHTIGTATATERVAKPVGINISPKAMQPFTNPGDPVSLAMLNDVDSAMLVTLHIDDPSDEVNYYRLTVDYYGTYLACYPEGIYGDLGSSASEDSYFITREDFYPHYLLTESSSRLVINSEVANQLIGGLLYLTSYNSFIFSDEQLSNSDGQSTIDFLMLMESPRTSGEMFAPESGWMGGNEWTDGFIFPSDTVSHVTYHHYFMLENLSADYYHYLKSVSSYDMLGGAFVGEPTPVHTNIHGGLGIVGSYSARECYDTLNYKLSHD